MSNIENINLGRKEPVKNELIVTARFVRAHYYVALIIMAILPPGLLYLTDKIGDAIRENTRVNLIRANEAACRSALPREKTVIGNQFLMVTSTGRVVFCKLPKVK